MGSPITWRTVAGPAPAQALDPLLASQRTFGSAFDAFNRVLAQREAFAAEQAAGVREGNKQAFLDALQQATTPEAVEALKASGQLDVLKGRLTPENLAAVRREEDARLAATRQQVLADQQYGDAQTLRGQRGLEDSLSSALAKGDLVTYDQLRQANPNMLNGAKFDQARATAEQVLVRQSRENIDYGQRLVDRERSNEIADLNLKTLRRTAAEAERQQRLEGVANEFVSNRQDSITAMKDAIIGAAGSYTGKLVHNEDGSIAADRMESKDKEAFNAFLTSKGLPTLDDVQGDTSGLTLAIQSLREAGATPVDIERLRPALTAGLTTTPQAPIGDDLARLERNQRVQDATIQLNSQIYTPMLSPGSAGSALDAAFAAIDARIPRGTWENDNWKQAVSKEIETGGIIAEDSKGNTLKDAHGNPIRVLPGADAWKQIISKRRDWVGWGAADLNKSIKEWRQNRENIVGAGKAVEAQLLSVFRNVDRPKTK